MTGDESYSNDIHWLNANGWGRHRYEVEKTYYWGKIVGKRSLRIEPRSGGGWVCFVIGGGYGVASRIVAAKGGDTPQEAMEKMLAEVTANERR